MSKEEFLDAEQSETVRALVRALKAKHGKQTAVAEATGLRQQQVSRILGGGPVGLPTAKVLADKGLLDFAALLAKSPQPIKLVGLSEEETFEDYCRLYDVDPEGPSAEKLRTTFIDLQNRYQVLTFALREVRRTQANDKGKPAAKERSPDDVPTGPKVSKKDSSSARQGNDVGGKLRLAPTIPPKVTDHLKPEFEPPKAVARRKADRDSHKPPR